MKNGVAKTRLMPACACAIALVVASLIAATSSVAAATVRYAGAPSAENAAGRLRPALPVTTAGVQVMYHGHMVSYAKLNKALGNTYCDDFLGYGKLTCYGTERAMESYLLAHGGYGPQAAARVARQLGVASYPPERTQPSVSAAAATCYPAVIVQLWSKVSYAGSEVNIFCDYPNLGAIGWGGTKIKSADIVNVNLIASLFRLQDYLSRTVELDYLLAGISSIESATNSELRGT